MLGVNESARLVRALRKEHIPCKRIIVNQIVDSHMGARYLEMKLKDQDRTLAMVESDPELHGLQRLRGPYLDLEVRGVPALRYFGRVVWADAIDGFAAGQQRK